jgi:hypothetical protein
MSHMLRRSGRAVRGRVTKDRRAFKRIDASPIVFDDGSWVLPRRVATQSAASSLSGYWSVR